MKLGLIARADNSGLGNQTWEFARHMQPAKTLVIDVGYLHDRSEHCNKATYLDRYPNATVFKGWTPDLKTLYDFLEGLDVVFTCETPYHPGLFELAKYRGVKTVLQYNWEMLGNLNVPTMPHPDLYLAPSKWHFEDFPWQNVTHLPVPIATDRFRGPNPRKITDPVRFLHVVGRPAVHDRNGTNDLIAALPFCQKDIDLTVVTQDQGFRDDYDDAPDHVTIHTNWGDRQNYWELYEGYDVLVMPRRYGGLCLPMNEALGASMPVIMPNISPNNDILPANWMVPAKTESSFRSKSDIALYSCDPQKLARCLDKFTDPAYLEVAVRQAQRLAEDLSWEALKPQYDMVFQDLLEEP